MIKIPWDFHQHPFELKSKPKNVSICLARRKFSALKSQIPVVSVLMPFTADRWWLSGLNTRILTAYHNLESLWKKKKSHTRTYKNSIFDNNIVTSWTSITLKGCYAFFSEMAENVQIQSDFVSSVFNSQRASCTKV